MTPGEGPRTSPEEAAASLGRVARVLDGSVSPRDAAAARERFLVALANHRPRRAAWALAAVVLSAAAALSAFLLLGKPADLGYSLSDPSAAKQEWVEVPAEHSAVAVRFTEGTELELEPGGKGRVASVTPDGARFVLGAGVVRARVVHRERAAWSVVAGPYVVEVTGTTFDVGWSAPNDRLEVRLHEGGVTVRGPAFADGIRVTAGQRLVAHARTGGAELSSLFAPEKAESAPGASAAPPAEAPVAPGADGAREPSGGTSLHPAPGWSELVAAGKFREVLDAARSRGFEQTLGRGSLADLAALSDAARYAGDRALSRRGLTAQRTRFAGSAEARTAAFLLGRLSDDEGATGQALEWYGRYSTESPKGTFAAEALGRSLVALVKLGNDQVARSTAERYLARFPRGAHATYARELLSRR